MDEIRQRHGQDCALIVPDTISDIESFTETELMEAYPYYRGTFGFFTSLKTFKTSGVKTVGEAVFVSVVVDEATEDIRYSYSAMLKSVDLPAAKTIGKSAFGGTALKSLSLSAVAIIGDSVFRECTTFESLAFGTSPPTFDGSDVFLNAGRDKGFTIYVPTAQAKTALEAAIADTGSDWYKAPYYTNIGYGKFKGVAVTPQ